MNNTTYDFDFDKYDEREEDDIIEIDELEELFCPYCGEEWQNCQCEEY